MSRTSQREVEGIVRPRGGSEEDGEHEEQIVMRKRVLKGLGKGREGKGRDRGKVEEMGRGKENE